MYMSYFLVVGLHTSTMDSDGVIPFDDLLSTSTSTSWVLGTQKHENNGRKEHKIRPNETNAELFHSVLDEHKNESISNTFSEFATEEMVVKAETQREHFEDTFPDFFSSNTDFGAMEKDSYYYTETPRATYSTHGHSAVNTTTNEGENKISYEIKRVPWIKHFVCVIHKEMSFDRIE